MGKLARGAGAPNAAGQGPLDAVGGVQRPESGSGMPGRHGALCKER